jgi:hypothetical protein
MEINDILQYLELKMIIPFAISSIAAYVSYHYSRKTKQHAEIVLLNNYISEAVEALERKGSAINYIRSIVLADDKKEIVWKNCHLRYKGQLPDRPFLDIRPTSSFACCISLGEYKPILRLLGEGQFSEYTLKMISSKTGIEKAMVKKGLDFLWENGLSDRKTTVSGTYWSLTQEGWNLYNIIERDQPSGTI